MSKIIRTQKPSVLPFYAMALVFVVLCAVLPVYKLWALLVALGGAAVAFGVAKKTCPPRVVEHEVPFHTGVEAQDKSIIHGNVQERCKDQEQKRCKGIPDCTKHGCADVVKSGSEKPCYDDPDISPCCCKKLRRNIQEL